MRKSIVVSAGVLLFVLLLAGTYFVTEKGHFPSKLASVEVGFTALSPAGQKGGEIIPASCPSYEHFLGECTSGPVPLVGPAHGTTVGFPHAHSGASVTDVDGDLSSYVWFFTLCPGVCPAITNETGALSGTSSPISGPTYTPNVAGEYWIALYVTDAAGHYGVAYLVETAVPLSPDLLAVSVVPSGVLQENQTVFFTAPVKNIGLGDAASSTGQFRIDLNNNGTYDITTTRFTRDIKVGVTLSVVSWGWTAVAGTHKVEFCADSGNVLVESDETNNCASNVFVVTPQVSHLACVSNTCTLVPGPGANTCGPVGSGCGPIGTCGDGIIQPPEDCDGINLGGETCSSLGFGGGGALSCSPICKFITTQCKTKWKEIQP